MRHRREFIRFMVTAGIGAGVLGTIPAPVRALVSPENVVPNAARQPSFHRSQSSGVPLGSLVIPSIGVDEIVRSGVAMSVIDLGPAHWAGTALPGQAGNVVLAGHRTTKTRPFYDLDRLDPDDLIYMTDGDGFEVMYSVSGTMIVEPNDLWITYETPDPTLTMFACHPKGSERYRIVVQADLVGRRRIG